MTTIHVRWQGDGLARITAAVDTLAGPKKLAGMRRAINHTGDKVYTEVRRLISKRAGVAQKHIDHYGAMKRVRANDALLEYQIQASGKGIPLKVFGARQTQKGVSVSVWGKRYLLPHAFIVGKAGGHVFWRVGKERLPLKKPTGPSIPKELVKRYVDNAFQRRVNSDLPARVEHEVKVITNGVVS